MLLFSGSSTGGFCEGQFEREGWMGFGGPWVNVMSHMKVIYLKSGNCRKHFY